MHVLNALNRQRSGTFLDASLGPDAKPIGEIRLPSGQYWPVRRECCSARRRASRRVFTTMIIGSQEKAPPVAPDLLMLRRASRWLWSSHAARCRRRPETLSWSWIIEPGPILIQPPSSDRAPDLFLIGLLRLGHDISDMHWLARGFFSLVINLPE
jgi:hypothetical protein